jgi:ABC-2 type transport system permease protein
MTRIFLGIFRYEYRMMVLRRGPWLAYALVFVFHALSIMRLGSSASSPFIGLSPWKTAGQFLYILNLFTPLIAGIAAADRLIRDDRLGVRELQRSAPLGPASYLLGKYAGVLTAALTPNILFVLIIGGVLTLSGAKTAALWPALLAAFASITVPAFAFVVAFSLVCPLLLPIRVYQILFTGYWFWGNYLNAVAFPTLNGTILTPAGIFVLQGFFESRIGPGHGELHSPAAAVANLIVIFAMAAAALLAAARWMDRSERIS